MTWYQREAWKATASVCIVSSRNPPVLITAAFADLALWIWITIVHLYVWLAPTYFAINRRLTVLWLVLVFYFQSFGIQIRTKNHFFSYNSILTYQCNLISRPRPTIMGSETNFIFNFGVQDSKGVWRWFGCSFPLTQWVPCVLPDWQLCGCKQSPIFHSISGVHNS
jgi:hypothetical protein